MRIVAIGKVAGKDSILAEMLELPGSHLQQERIRVLKRFWKEGKVPQDLKDAVVVPIYKRKSDKHSCGNITVGSLCCLPWGRYWPRLSLCV